MKTKLAATGGATQTFVDDVFSTYLYTGNGSTQTITNGIDLAGKGGLVWVKARNQAYQHGLFDTARGASQVLVSNNTDPQGNYAPLSSFNSTGFSLSADYNASATTYASWTFRKAAKFFDVVTWSGNSVNGRAIPHNLGVAPGMVIVKILNKAGENWRVWHRSGTQNNTYGANLNDTSIYGNKFANLWGAPDGSAPDMNASTFSVGDNTSVNESGYTYVAYLFAHDTSSTGIIQCGSFTTDASGNATVNLGWEPQYVLVKSVAVNNSDWKILDTMRGAPTASSQSKLLFANTSGVETTGSNKYPIATGFQWADYASTPFIYMAIRMPNKPPTTGTQVYLPTTWAGNGNTGLTVSSLTSPVDLAIVSGRGGQDPKLIFSDRLRGSGTGENGGNMRTLVSTSNVEESASSLNGYYATLDYQNSVRLLGSSSGIYNGGGASYVLYSFKRAPGFFDVVCYTGTGTGTVNHNLGVAPELIIVKNRNTAGYDWKTLTTSPTAGTLNVNTTAALNTADNPYYFGNGSSYVAPTSTVFSVYNNYNVGASGEKYVAYLFATLAGISKVGSYTGNGSSQNIECGFAAGARFVLIKRTDSTGDWFVWDTARGIVSANDPHLSLNTTAAEITTDDSVDPYSAGFAVNQVAATNINVSSATYIFLAIA